ncbi:MAG: hypothetical protein OEQ53_00045 [Saprospiraceae bacterium]|nr:hypothetical protein [Saprospiraceae bacterium]
MKLHLDLKQIARPVVQATWLFIGCFICQLIVLIVGVLSSSGTGYAAWIISASFLLLYAFFNAMLLLRTENIGVYISRSSYSYIGMVIATSLLAFGVSSITFGNAGSTKWIYIIITLCYTIFLVIVFLMRKIIEYAQRQDTEQKD